MHLLIHNFDFYTNPSDCSIELWFMVNLGTKLDISLGKLEINGSEMVCIDFRQISTYTTVAWTQIRTTNPKNKSGRISAGILTSQWWDGGKARSIK